MSPGLEWFLGCRTLGGDVSPLVIELDPLRAAGPVLLGASFEETGRVLAAWGAPQPHAPYPGAEPLDWRLTGSGVEVHVFCGSAGVVQTVEICRDFDVEPRPQVVLLGVDLFSTSAEQVLAGLRARYDVEADQGDCGLVVPELSIGMSRSGIPYPRADQETIGALHVFRERADRGPGLLRPTASQRGVMSAAIGPGPVRDGTEVCRSSSLGRDLSATRRPRTSQMHGYIAAAASSWSSFLSACDCASRSRPAPLRCFLDLPVAPTTP
jgi:hypothetical protein